jgi:hypothetical protein
MVKCGTTLSASGTTAPEADCSMPCGGDKTQSEFQNHPLTVTDHEQNVADSGG